MEKTINVYYISGNTGILARNLGKALLAQFPGITFHGESFPFIRTEEDARAARRRILTQSLDSRPIVFSTVFVRKLNDIFNTPEIHFLNVCEGFLLRLEYLLEARALRLPGSSRQHDDMIMAKRVNAIQFSIAHDDGTNLKDYDEADLILIGVSRSGKTPVSIYLATQMGMKTANYPLVEEDLQRRRLPPEVIRNRGRVAAISTSARMLHVFRENRYKGSRYARLATCAEELEQARELCQLHKIPVIISSGRSIEETATQIVHELGLKAAITF
ncbi:MAG: pyruvate, phosphate dikinase/phosphoenolpyruvate synthase regulator [Desulfocapsaceae bacterium]|nr:pyruvate, phosphate dikinase/phosphoenolpyruvate synthase regulator [Desulfocapsaceae bacterium]